MSRCDVDAYKSYGETKYRTLHLFGKLRLTYFVSAFLMEETFLTVFYEMESYHENSVQAWTERSAQLETWTEGLLNHREQRELYTRLPVHQLDIVIKSPRLKDKLLHKLNLKINSYDALLRDQLGELEEQLERVRQLSGRCQELALAIPPAALLYQTDSRPPLSSLLEICYDIDQLYTLQHHKMMVFLNQEAGWDKSAFLFAEPFGYFLRGVGSKS